MKISILLITLSLGISNLFGQNYLDVIRPFQGMAGGSNYESNVAPAAMVSSSALLGNPALLSYSDKAFVSGDLSINQIDGTSIVNSRVTESKSDSQFGFNSMSYVNPVHVYRGAWVWGVSLQEVHAFTSNSQFSSIDSVLLSEEYYQYDYSHEDRESGGIYALTVGTSALVTMNTSLGISLSYLTGKNTFTRIYKEEDTSDYFTTSKYVDSLVISPRYRGLGASIGLLSELSESLNIGASVEFPSWVSVAESSSLNLTALNDNGVDTLNYSDNWHDLDYTVWGPWRLGFGLGFIADPLKLSVNYQFHSYTTTALRGNLLDPITGGDLENTIDKEIQDNVENVHEFSASLLWSLEPLQLSFAATLMNDPLIYRLDNIIYMDVGVGYHLSSGLGLTFALRNEQWQGDLNHILNSGIERSVVVENTLSKFQFGLKYFL